MLKAGSFEEKSPLRDVLLLKCKGAIEELHRELEEMQKAKALLEEKAAKTEREAFEKENFLREERFYKEKLEGFRDFRSFRAIFLRNLLKNRGTQRNPQKSAGK